MPFLFEKLDVYQLSVNFAEKVSNLTQSFPKGNYYLSDQINRASISISLNIAEGNGRFHPKERKQFFYISRGSVHECVPLLELIKRKELIGENNFDCLNKELERISKMLSGLIAGCNQ